MRSILPGVSHADSSELNTAASVSMLLLPCLSTFSLLC